MIRLALLFVLFFPVFIFSQTDNKKIEGTVTNPNSEPISNASIKIIANDTNGIVKQFAFSNSNGKFSIKLSSVAYQLYLQISVLGYTTFNVKVTDSLINKPSQFIMLPLTKALPEVYVKAENQITKKGDTTSFKVSSFAKGNENTIADLLKRLPGLSIDESGTIKFNGKNIDAVLLEDDDLFGSNYGNLVNNSGISGIEKVEVIENYKSKDRIENSLTKGKQTVLNLRYKGAGIRNFGQATIGYAPYQNPHDMRLNLTTLSKRVKAVSIGNKNSTGFLAQQLFGLTNENDLPDNKNIEYPQTIELQKTPISFNNIEPKNINKYRIFDNNSSLATTNLLFKLTKKILFKNNYAFVQDNFLQNYNSSTTYIGGVIPTTILQESKIAKNNNFFFTEGETSLNWGEKNQTRINYFFSSGKGLHSTDGFFQNNILTQTLQNNNSQGSLLLTHVILLKEKSFINIKYNYYSGNTAADYMFTNPLADTSLNIKNTDKNIIQLIAYNQKVHTASANWFKVLNSFSLSVTLNEALKNITPTSNTLLTRQDNTQANFKSNFQVEQQIKIAETELSVNLSKNFSSRLQASFVNKFKNLSYKKDVLNDSRSEDKLFYLPSLNITFKPTNKSHLSLNSSLQAQAPNADQLNKASIFMGNNNITTGTNEINLQSGYTLNLFYVFSDFAYKRYSYYASLFYSNLPTLYTNNFTASNLYMFNSLVPFNKNNNNFNANIGFDKNLVKLKSWLTLKTNYNAGTFFSNNNTVLITNNVTNLKSELKYRTNWNKWFNISTTIAYTTSTQKSLISTFELNNFTNSEWLTNTTIELKLYKNWFIDIQHDYLVNHSYNKPVQHIQFLDTKCKYNFNNKWSGSLLLRNILNTNAFTTSSSSTTQNTVQNFTLTPFFGLFTLGYKF